MAMAKQIQVGVIGAGGRSAYLCKNLFGLGPELSLKAVYDPDATRSQALAAGCGQPGARIARSYEEITGDPEISWVMVVSPNCYHREHVVAAFAGGKHVFSEKPLATSIPDCVAMHQAHHAAGKIFATGFVLRYAPIYQKVRELIDAGTLGRILSIDANENITPDHGAYIMRNWRRLTKFAGPHILEKCCHDLDLINWFVGSLPRRAAAFAGQDLFIPANLPLRDKYRRPDGSSKFDGWPDPHLAGEDAFTVDKDLLDNQVGILEYRNGARVMFQATMANAIPERRMYLSGTEGTLIVELYSGTLKVRNLGDDAVRNLTVGGDLHGGGDMFIMKELRDSMLSGKEPRCGGEEGLVSTVTALALDQAAREGRVIDLEPVWRDLGR
jgi:predicted dehydrogenase